MRHLLGTVLACALLVVTAGCGEQEGADAPGGATDAPTASTPTTSTPTTSTPTTSPSDRPDGQQTTPPSEGLQKTRVVGQVAQIGDCVVVRDDNGTTWTITGPLSADLVLDDRVGVTGTPDIAAMGCGGPVVQASRIDVLPGA